MKDNTATMNAAQNLMSARQQIKALKEHEKKLRDEFAATILLDAIEQPSRVMRIDRYWRLTGLLPMEVEKMVAHLIGNTDDPRFMALKTSEVFVTRRYAEFSEDGRPTGNVIKKTEKCPVIINLGEVQPPRNGEEPQPATLGSASLLESAKTCRRDKCSYLKKDMKCPYSSEPGSMWKCAYNWDAVQDVINAILAELRKEEA